MKTVRAGHAALTLVGPLLCDGIGDVFFMFVCFSGAQFISAAQAVDSCIFPISASASQFSVPAAIVNLTRSNLLAPPPPLLQDRLAPILEP